MKPFKTPYRAAAAGATMAAVCGAALTVVAGRILNARSGRPLEVLGCGAAAGAAFAILYYPPYCRRKEEPKAVFLTFDDGPDGDVTPKVLDALQAGHARATFFILGTAALQHPDLVRRIAAEGHTLGIHGWDHRPVTLQTPGALLAQFEQARHAIEQASPGCRVTGYRPTYGLRGPGVGSAIRRLGLRMTLWTLDSHDYLSRSPDAIRKRLEMAMREGDVILMHDAGETGRATAMALPDIVVEVARRGWRCAPLHDA